VISQVPIARPDGTPISRRNARALWRYEGSRSRTWKSRSCRPTVPGAGSC
jgi:hypothetical protein